MRVTKCCHFEGDEGRGIYQQVEEMKVEMLLARWFVAALR